MSEEIGGVKLIVNGIVDLLNLLPLTRPDNWLLERFGDPDVGPAFFTESAEALQNAVNALVASGGGDCPELSQTALLEAIDNAFPNSRLFVFTDASAKDSSLANLVISRAQAKAINISYAPTGSCSPIDQAYIRGAEETGGQLFVINPSEVNKLFSLMEPQLSGDLMTVLSNKGQLLSGSPQIFNIPVDSTIQRLVVSVSTSLTNSVSLRRPNGNLINSSDPDVQITDLSSGRIFSIDKPSSATWQVELSGSGDFSVVAAGNSSIEFHRFDFVEPNEDIHGGFFPIPGQPVVGGESTGAATMLGPFATGNFKLVDETGLTIKQITLVQNFPEADSDSFVGTFTLPTVPFRIVATGTDQNGFQYQRQFPTVYRAQVVGVEVSGMSSDRVPAGKTTTSKFTVTNLGGAASFRVDVVDNLGFVTKVNPTALNLAAKASGMIQADITVPKDTPDGTGLTITTTATKTDDVTVFNSATLNLTVAAAVAEHEICGNCVDDDGDGLIDLLDPDCPSSPLSIKKGTLKLAPGVSGNTIEVTAHFTTPVGNINPLRDGMIISLIDTDGVITCLNFPPGANWRTKPGTKWFFDDPTDNSASSPGPDEKASVEFNDVANQFEVSVTVRKGTLTDANAGNISTSVLIGDNAFLNTQEWRPLGGGTKLFTKTPPP